MEDINYDPLSLNISNGSGGSGAVYIQYADFSQSNSLITESCALLANGDCSFPVGNAELATEDGVVTLSFVADGDSYLRKWPSVCGNQGGTRMQKELGIVDKLRCAVDLDDFPDFNATHQIDLGKMSVMQWGRQ